MEIWVADQQSQTQLNIIGVTREDLRSYLCVAKNSMGEMSRKIRLTGNIMSSVLCHCDLAALSRGHWHCSLHGNSLIESSSMSQMVKQGRNLFVKLILYNPLVAHERQRLQDDTVPQHRYPES